MSANGPPTKRLAGARGWSARPPGSTMHTFYLEKLTGRRTGPTAVNELESGVWSLAFPAPEVRLSGTQS